MLEQAFQNLLGDLVQLVAILLGLGIAYSLNVGIGFLKSKLKAEQFAFMKEAARTIVRFLEQLGTIDAALAEGAKKKEAALLYLSNFAEENGLPVDYELLDAMIEEAVQVMNAEVAPVIEAEFGE